MKRHNSSGFTLVELSFVIIISGFIVLALFQGYVAYNEDRSREKSKESLEKVEAALAAFLRTNQRYPCPADPYLGPGDAGYGYEPASCTNGTLSLSSGDLDWFANQPGIDTYNAAYIVPAGQVDNRDPNRDGDLDNDFVFYFSYRLYLPHGLCSRGS